MFELAWVIMHATVDLDHQTFIGAMEVHDVLTEAVLSSEFPAIESSFFQ